MSDKPQLTRNYVEHPMIDATRWDAYNHRADDIVISTSYKAGTTWMQTIVANLLYQDGVFPAPVSVMAPWLDMALPPLAEVAAGLEAQSDRRFIKTHLPLDGIPYFETAKYIYVGRDGRDVFMSLWNHHTNYSDDIKEYNHQTAKQHGRRYPSDYDDLHALYADWIGKSWYHWGPMATLTGRTFIMFNHGGIIVTLAISTSSISLIYWRIPSRRLKA
ncbi:MAG: aryl sulfotransferase [Arenicella sp.]|jgi:aryl sulfotransferase